MTETTNRLRFPIPLLTTLALLAIVGVLLLPIAAEAQATAPEAPTGLTATALGATIIDLAWTAPADNGGSAITGYKVEVSDDGTSGSWSDLEDDTESTNVWYRHTGLSDAETRHYRVSAINAQGTSDSSSTANATTMAGEHYAVPTPIYGEVIWSAEMTVGSPTAARLGYQEGGSRVHGALSPSTFDHDGTRTVTSLYADSLVTLLVWFDAALGAGKYNLHLGPTLLDSDRLATSNFAGLVLLEDPPWQHGDTVDIRLVQATSPNMPTGLSATSSGTTQIDLEWTAPTDDGGRAVNGYRIEVSDDGSSGSWDELVADTGSADTEYSDTGLSAGQTRHYRVSAINAAGMSDASDSDDATTQRAAPDPPTLSSAAVPDLAVILINLDFDENLHGLSTIVSNSIVAAFTVTADGVEREIDAIRSGNNRLQISFAPGTTIYQGQTVVVSYDKSVAGNDAIADSDGDEVASFTTGDAGVPAVVNNSNLTAPLPAPTGFSAEAGDGEVTLSWDEPGSGSDVTHHDYRFKTVGSYGDWIEIPDSGPGETNASGFTVTTDIENGTAYTFNLRAGGADDDSPAVGLEAVTPMVELAPPTTLRATPGDRQATLTWTPPAAGSGYTQHQYRYREGTKDWEHWKTIPDSGPNEANGSRYTVTELANAREYTFELRASDGGTGRSRAAETEVTPQGPPRIERVRVVSSPGLDGDTYGREDEIRLEVTFDQDVQVTGNPRFQFDLGGSNRQAAYASGDGTMAVLFDYRVRADDRDDDGIEVGANALRLSGGSIDNNAGHAAELTHDSLGMLSRHKVNGRRVVGRHEHEKFRHTHSVRNDGNDYYIEEYPSHEHDSHEHRDQANGHPSLNGPLKVHTHHVPADSGSVSGGPDERGHGGVEHIHRCFSLQPACTKGADYNRGDELGLPIEWTHRHDADSEPGHGFDWTAWFEEGGSGATVSVADAEAVGGKDAHLRFEVTLEPALEFAVRVKYATADGTAAEGEDYTRTRGTLEIPPGETRATARVRVRDRESDDGDETMSLTLRSATAVTVADGEATGTIRAPEATTPPEIEDIDVVSTPRLSSSGGTKDTYGEGENIRIEVEFDQPVLVEGDPVLMLEVCDRGESLCEAEARYESGSGTDTLVFAYLVLEVDVDRNGIAIPADPIDVSIDDFDGFSIRNDAGQEADLSYRREGTKSGHKVNGSRQAGQYLSVEDAEAHEADGEMTFTVRLEPRGLGIVTVNYATRDGSARAGSDYTETSGRLRFNPLERERTVTVPIIDDAHQDDRETFTLRLSNPDGALLGDARATGTIRNSDPVASVQPHTEDGLEHAWLFVLVPDGNGDVTFALVAEAACDEGGICTPGGSTLTEAPEASTIPGPGDAEQTAESPDKPRNLSATATHNQVFLTWDDPSDSSITGYVILRRLPGVDQEGHFNELMANTGSAATTYTDNDVAADTRYTYRIKAINEAGTSERSRWAHIDTPAAPEPDSNNPATGAPAITGTAQVGETLRVDTSGIADEDGLENATFGYQWLADGTAISGATANAYMLVAADEGKAITVRVSFTDDAGNEESLTSAATAAVAAEPTEPPDKPQGLEATVSNGQVTLTWNDPNDESITGYVILRRIRVNDQGGDFSVLVSNTETAATTYTDDTVAASTTYTYRIKAINQHGVSERSRWYHIDTPAPTEPETPPEPDNSPATGAPTISGTVQVGETLTANTSGIADEDGLGNVQYEYWWLADDAEIAGATGSTYTVAAADEGKAITVRVSFSDDAGNDETLTSAATEAVAAAEPTESPDKPTGLDATVSHGQVVLTWNDPNDDSITGYVILRRIRVNDQGGDFSVLVANTETAATTYTDDTVAASTTYTYRIKAINEAGTSERSRWVHIDTPAPPVPDKPTGLEATMSNGQVVLTWDYPDDDSITGYVILRRVRVNDQGGDFSVLVANTGSAATTYTDDEVAASTTYTYRIKAINAHGTSERSRWYHIDTPAAP